MASLDKRLENAIKAEKRKRSKGGKEKASKKKASKRAPKKKSGTRRKLSAAERERRELAAVDRAIAQQLAHQRKREMAEHAALEREFGNIDRAEHKRRGHKKKKRGGAAKKGKLSGKSKAAFLARMARGRAKAKRKR